jgi:hypothetical protein
MVTRKRLALFLALCVLSIAGSVIRAQTIHPKGATIWDPFRARNGYTFISAADGTARLVGMLGELVQTWSAGPNDSLLVKMPILASPGHILAFRAVVPIPGYARGRGSFITEYDFNGNPVWEYTPGAKIDIFDFGGFHHDMVRLSNGNTLAMASVLVNGSGIAPGKQLIDDCIIEISPDKKIVWAWYTFIHFDEFGFSDAAKAQIASVGGDWAHANAVTVIPENTYADPRFKPGNLIISYRNLNTIIVIDKETGSIVWKTGPADYRTIGQHYAYMIPPGLEGAGKIMAFDNGGSGGYPAVFRVNSRVVEIEPLFKAVTWTYQASNSGLQNWSFFSPFISNAQRLHGSNTLIVEGTKGRIFEVTSTGDLVWEYMVPFSELRNEGGRPVWDQNVYRAFRLPYFWPYAGAPPDGGV